MPKEKVDIALRVCILSSPVDLFSLTSNRSRAYFRRSIATGSEAAWLP
jgi:hypothetical protein